MIREVNWNMLKQSKKFLNHSKYGGIIYILIFVVIIWIALYVIQAFLSCLFYKKLTPENYEVGYVRSYRTDNLSDDGNTTDSNNYKVDVSFKADGKKYHVDLDIPVSLKTKVRDSGVDAKYVIGDIYYRKSNPKKVKIVGLRRHVLPFTGNQYICKDNLNDFCEEVWKAILDSDWEKLASISYLGPEEEATAKNVEENLASDFEYYKENKIDIKSLQYKQFDSDCTRYVMLSDESGKGKIYYITVKDGKYKLDLRYRM